MRAVASHDGEQATNTPRLTGPSLQWMLNSAWPSNVWHLYDFFLVPDAGYHATRAACAALLHIQYSYDDAKVRARNDVWTVATLLEERGRSTCNVLISKHSTSFSFVSRPYRYGLSARSRLHQILRRGQ